MICIDLEYRSWWWPFTRRLRSFAPSRWWEMDERHYLAIVRAILGEIDDDTLYAKLFGIPKRLARDLDPWHRHILERQMSWIDTGRSESSRFFIRKICGLKAPDDSLGGMSLQQFMTADTFFSQYADSVTEEKPSGDEMKLARMVASIYMRKEETYFVEKDGDVLCDIEGNAAMLVKKARRCHLWGVYLNWLMIRNWLSKAYPLLFPTADPEPHGKEAAPRKKNAWLDVFDSFMGDDVAHLDTYRKMMATDAFRLMNRRIRTSIQNQKIRKK